MPHHVQAVFMLIGKTSALTMNIAGVIKDWMLIFLSFYLFHAPVTALNLLGYAFCCTGVRMHPAPVAPPAHILALGRALRSRMQRLCTKSCICTVSASYWRVGSCEC